MEPTMKNAVCEWQVSRVLQLAQDGLPSTRIAKAVGLCRSTVSKILSGQHVSMEDEDDPHAYPQTPEEYAEVRSAIQKLYRVSLQAVRASNPPENVVSGIREYANVWVPEDDD